VLVEARVESEKHGSRVTGAIIAPATCIAARTIGATHLQVVQGIVRKGDECYIPA